MKTKQRIYFEIVTELADKWGDDKEMTGPVLEAWERASSEGIMELAENLTNKFMQEYNQEYDNLNDLLENLWAFLKRENIIVA